MLTKKEVERLRTETRGCESVLHFNNAGAALMPDCVLEAVIGHLKLEADKGGYEARTLATPKYEAVYRSIAALIGAEADEIALVENATAGWQAAFGAIVFNPGDRILTARASYASNYLNFLLAKERHGVEICVLPDDAYGQVSISELKARLDERVKLLAITHIPTGGGLVNPVEEITALERPEDCIYLLDACQSVGQVPLDVGKIGCDVLSTTGRKWLRAPRGTGFLYVRKERIESLVPPFIDLHSAEWTSSSSYSIRGDARRFENWESNIAAQIGLGVAVDYALKTGMERIWQRIRLLGRLLRAGLAEVPGISVHDTGKVKGGIVTFSSAILPSVELQQRLLDEKMNVSVAIPSGTLLDAEARHLPEMIRASVHYYNTENEIERFVDKVRQLTA